MNPFVQTLPQSLTYNMVNRLFPQLKAATYLFDQILEETDAGGAIADFDAAEIAGGADEGTPTNYGGYDSRDVHRWMELTIALQAFLDDAVTVTFADATTEATTVRELIGRPYLSFVEPEV